MHKLLTRLFIVMLGFSMLAAVSAGQQLDHELGRVQEEWVALLNAPTTADEKAEAVTSLVRKAATLMARDNGEVESAFWTSLIAESRQQLADRPEANEALDKLQQEIAQGPPSV